MRQRNGAERLDGCASGAAELREHKSNNARRPARKTPGSGTAWVVGLLRLIQIGIVASAFLLNAAAWAQNVPAPSQVVPPQIVSPPPAGRISIPQVPAGAAIPAAAKRLNFTLTGFDIKGEFPELADERKAIAAPLIGRRVTVANVFEFADKLQQIYVRAGYPLTRVVILPQEFEQSARIKLRIIDGFIESLDVKAIGSLVSGRVASVLAPLINLKHLKQVELERRLLIAGDAAGLTLNATFSAGKKEGGSILILTGRFRPVSLSFYTDNAMPSVFGSNQIVTAVSLNSLLGLGEQFTFSAAGLPEKDFDGRYPTRRYLSGKAVLPIGIDGLKLEFGATDGITTPRVDSSTATQGLLKQGYGKLSYDYVKLRDAELTIFGRFDATDEELDTLLFSPAVPLSLDRVRTLRGGFEGVWRLRSSGTTINYASTVSRGLDAFGARTAADATFLLPLSRQGADAKFSKLEGRVEVTQALPENFSTTAIVAGQTSFNHPLLTSEQYSIDGTRQLSGFTAGSLAGDTAWVVRGELGKSFSFAIDGGGIAITPYLFAAAGERKYINPTVVELASLHVANYGTGVRFNLSPWREYMPAGYGFIEWSHRAASDNSLDGDRIFTGVSLQY
jgi:hemolysin activation/secretion protein